MIKWPTKLAGSSAITRWLNLFLAASKSSELVDGPDYWVQRKPTGTQIRFRPGGPGGATGEYFTYRICRNGTQIDVELDSKQDPTTLPEQDSTP